MAAGAPSARPSVALLRPQAPRDWDLWLLHHRYALLPWAIDRLEIIFGVDPAALPSFRVEDLVPALRGVDEVHLLAWRLMADHRCRNRRAAMHPSAAGHHDPHGAFVNEPGIAGFGVFFRLGRLRQCRRKEIVNAGHGRAVGLNSPDRRRAQRNLLEARILGLGSARYTSGNGRCGDGHVQWLAHELALRRVGVAGEHDADKARRQKEPLHGATSKTVPPPSDTRAKQSP